MQYQTQQILLELWVYRHPADIHSFFKFINIITINHILSVGSIVESPYGWRIYPSSEAFCGFPAVLNYDFWCPSLV